MNAALLVLALLIQDPAAPAIESRGSLRHPSSVLSVAISPDSSTAYAGLDDGQLLAWSLSSGTFIGHDFRDYTGIRALSVSPDGTLVAVATQSGPFHLLEAGTLKPVKSLDPKRGQNRAVFAPDGKAVFVALYNGHLLRLKVPDLAVEKDIFPTEKSLAIALAVSPDGKWVATSDREGQIKLWTAEALAPVRTWKAHEKYAFSLAFHPSKPLLASGGEDHALKVWNAENGSPVADSRDVHHESIQGLAFAPDGRLISVGQDGLCQFWEADTFKSGRSFPNYRGYFSAVAVSADGERAVRGGSALDVVPTGDPEGYTRLASFGGSIQALDIAANATSIVSAGLDRRAIVWSVTEKIASKAVDLDDWGTAAAFSRDGKKVAIGLGSGTVELYDAEGLNRTGRWTAHRGRVAALVPTDSGWASSGDDGKVSLWDSEGAEVASFAEEGAVRALASHGPRVAAGTSTGAVALYDAGAKSLLRRAAGRPVSVTALRFARDGTRLAAGYFDGAVETLDPDKLSATASRPGDGQGALALAFSPNGNFIAAGFRDGMMRLLEASSLAVAASRRLDSGREVFGIGFTLDEKTFVAGGADHALTFWSVRGDLAAWRAREAGPQESRWEGRWSNAEGFVYDFVLDLKVDAGKVAGKFTWTLKTCPDTRDDLKGRVGASGTEELTGTWDSATRTVELKGEKVSDETLLAMDSYRIKVADSGDAIEGATRGNNGKWECKISGKRTGGRCLK
ncbi:MAG TPA: WD40 repeat domain-containing protein [Planctomycetota bacterium]|nr:WD40 repeat domain-containing protein [Planctomycetota bacterium]